MFTCDLQEIVRDVYDNYYHVLDLHLNPMEAPAPATIIDFGKAADLPTIICHCRQLIVSIN